MFDRLRAQPSTSSASEASTYSSEEQSASTINAMKTGPFTRSVQELVSYYLQLEEFYMVENVIKAVKIDCVTTPDALTSSMVDDVFYILAAASKRCPSTGSVQCVCACFNHVNNLLANEFRCASHISVSCSIHVCFKT